LRIMRGPNYWSVRHPKIVVAKVNLGSYKDSSTSDFEGFADRLEKMFPGMYSHRSTEGRQGGFFKLVRQGVALSQVIEHIALELQTSAGMDCGYGRSCPAKEDGMQYVIFSYQVE